MLVEKTLKADEIQLAIAEYIERKGLELETLVFPATEGDIEIFIMARVIQQPNTKKQ